MSIHCMQRLTRWDWYCKCHAHGNGSHELLILGERASRSRCILQVCKSYEGMKAGGSLNGPYDNVMKGFLQRLYHRCMHDSETWLARAMAGLIFN